MGKDKSAQRTKGNKKPSSSGRMAEHLGGATGFVGFSALQDLGYVPAALQGSPSDDSTISAEFRVALRKMSKKDATTKIKALQEFEALCGNGDVDSIKTALPFWPRLYAKLTIDVERRVREAAQIAHGALVSQVGKQLAPHLRSIMPSWVMGMVDPHPAASSAALKALQDVFAAEKIAEVMFFSGKEILEHIKDNLFMQTPQTLSDPKTTDEEDMKNKYIHVLVCSLKGISLLLTYTTRNTQKKSDVIALVQPLIQNPKFWKMSKHKHSMVRIAWFSTLSNMFEYDSGLLKCYSEEVSHVILPSLDDHEGAVLPHIWVAFLHLCLMYPALWHEGNNKSVFNRLYSVLRDCGRGSAAELYPHLLPIISIIPEEAVGDKTAFYIDFFRALSTGLNKSRMSLSSRDIHAILKALFECLKYVSMNKTDASLWEILMKYQIIEPLKLSFSDTPALSTSNLYREVSELLRFWTWKSHTEENQEAIGNLLALFWKNFIPECETCIQKGNEATLSKMKDFFTILRDPASKFTSRREGVRFTDESKKVSVDMKEEEDSANQKKKEQVFLEHAAKNIALLTVTCHVAFLETKSTSVYKIFATLLSSFPSDRVYTLLLNKQDEEKVSKLELMEEIIQPKLEIQNPSLAEHTVDIFMGVYTLMSPEEQKLVLLESKISWSISVLRRLLEKMTERRDTDQVAMSWLLSAQLGNRLIQLVEQLCGSTKSKSVAQYSQDEELVTLFNFVLSNGNKKDHIIAMEYVSQILKNLSFNLKLGEDSEPEDQMVQLVANLASQLFSSYVCWQTTGIQEFMRSLFLLQCQSWKSLSEQTVSTLKSTFLKAFSGLIASLVKEDSAKLLEDGSCLRSTLKDIKQIIMEDKSSFNLTMRMAMLTKNLLSLVYEQVKTQEVCGIMLDHSIIQALLEILAPTEGCWVQMEEQLSPLYMAPAILQGSIAFSEFPFPKKMQETVVWDHKHTRISMFFCDLLLFVCKQKNAEVLEEEEEVSLLILARRTDLRRISLDTPDHTAIVMPVSGVKHAIAVDFDPIDGFVYWTDDEAQCIQRAKLDGSEQQVVVSAEVFNPDGIAVDWVARNLYWTDTGPDRIEVARLNGTARKILIADHLDEPRAIAVDPDGGLMFWTDWGKRPKIERAALDGSMRLVIVSTDLGWPNGVAIDFQRRKIYWCDAKTDKIETALFDGTERKVLLSDHLPHVFGFSLLDNYLYWTDWQRRSIERVDTINGTREAIVEQLPDLMGLKAVNVNKKGGSNPCAIDNGNCSHLCLNRPSNNFTCGCPIGYELTQDGKVCVVPEAFLLYTRKEDIRRISLLTSHNVAIPVTGIEEAMAIDFDSIDNRLYWTDVSAKSISRAFMNGSQLEPVIEFGLEYPEGMAVDWLARNIYWADMGNHRIEVARLDGSSRRVLIWQNIAGPRSLALDPGQGYMYWSEWGDEPRISRAHLDASQLSVIVTDMGRANGLTIDFKDTRLYWTDIDNFRIESSDLEGLRREVIVRNLPQPYGLTLYEDYVYWADWNTGTIERANKTNGENRTRIQGQLDFVMDILVFHSSRQSGSNQCSINNGGCSHLCLAVPSTDTTENYTCACPTHYTLGADGKTCKAPSSFLLFSQKSVVSRLMEEENVCPTLILPIHNMRNVRAIDYDPVEQLVYWVDGRGDTLRKAHHNGTQSQVFVGNPMEKIYPYDIAVEPFTRVLLWSCARNNIINVTRLDGTQVGGIIGYEGDDKPRSLAVHPMLGLLFFVNMVSPPLIEQAHLDGLQRRKVISDGLRSPSALAVDIRENLLFWADSEKKYIETSNLYGEDRKILVDRDLGQPVGLAVHGDYLYWVDKDLYLVERVNKYTGQQREKVQGRLSHLSDIIAVSSQLYNNMTGHPCHNGSECSHLCLERDRRQHCACPEGKALADDMKTCINPPTCKPKMFRCHSGNVDCIPIKWMCDGQSECADKSDELDCPPRMCQSNQFQCHNGQCIDKSMICDGKSQCDDDSDEERCCGDGQVLCGSTGQCVDTLTHCQGSRLCPDNPDHAFCSTLVTTTDVPGAVSKAPYIVGVVASVVVLFCVAALVVYYRRRPSLLDDHELEPQPKTSQPRRYELVVTAWGKSYSAVQGEPPPGEPHPGMSMGGPSGHGMCIGIINPGAAMRGILDPAPVTGASSSSSSMTHYPRETLNPPPTPVAENRGRCQEPHCCYNAHHAPPSTLHSYRHYKTRNRPPPPTPCSTDVCDSDVYSSAMSPRGTHCYTPGFTTYYSSPPMTDYDSDPHPPPPTPQTQYMCDLTSCHPTSCPPSPSTERSYCTRAPCPPPPSPIASD